MRKRRLFDNLNEEAIPQLLDDLGAEAQSVPKGVTLLEYTANTPTSLHYLQSGEAKVEMFDAGNNCYLMDYIQPGEVFGDFYTMVFPKLRYVVTALSDSQMYIIDWKMLNTIDENNAEEQVHILENLNLMQAQKIQHMAFHLSLLFQPTTKEKLMAYLRFIQALNPGDDTFTLPITLSRLADYLNVDRASMMRCIQTLKQEGIIESKARKFKLLKPQDSVDSLDDENSDKQRCGAFIHAWK